MFCLIVNNQLFLCVGNVGRVCIGNNFAGFDYIFMICEIRLKISNEGYSGHLAKHKVQHSLCNHTKKQHLVRIFSLTGL